MRCVSLFGEEWEDFSAFVRAFYLNSICTLDLYISQIRVQILFKNSRSLALKLQLGCKLCSCQDRSVCFGSFLFPRRGLSRKAPSNARGDDPFLGGFFFGFFRPPRWGVFSQPGFTPAFAGIFISARAGFFILRELAEFG